MAEDGNQFEGVRRKYDRKETAPTYAVLESIAVFEHGNPNPTKGVLDAPLNNYIDTDALDKVVQSNASATIEFTVSTYNIQISGDLVGVTARDAN